MGRGPQMRDVELVEVHLDPGADRGADPGAGRAREDSHVRTRTVGDTGTTAPAPRRRRAGRRPAVALLLVLVAAGSALGAERREAARLEGLADVPGVLAPVEGPVAPLWRLPGPQLTSPRWLDGRVVSVHYAADGAVEAAALVPATGEELWRTVVAPPGSGSEPSAWCDSPARDGPEARGRLLACVVVDDTDTADAVGIGSVTYPTRTRLVVLDVATGVTRSDRPVPATTTMATLGPDLLLAHADDGGHVHLTRVDPLGGPERWQFRSREPVPPDELGQRWVGVQADDDVVVLDAGAAWALTADGEVLRSWPAPDRSDPVGRGGTHLLPGRGAVVRPDPATGLGEVVDLRSGRTFEVPGYPAALWPHDGSVPDLVLVDRSDGTGRAAYDVRSGRRVWASDGPPDGPGLLLDGRLISVGVQAVRALDARTGEPVWSTDLPATGMGPPVTDGRLVLVSGTRESGAAVVAAYGVDDGRERWSADLAEDVHLQTVDGALYGYTRDGVVAMGGAPADR